MADAAARVDSSGIPGAQIKAYLERIERLEEEKKGISEDIKDVFAEAKGNGFDVKVLRELLKRRRADPDERDEFETLVELYEQALGGLADTPLGKSATQRAVAKMRVTNVHAP